MVISWPLWLSMVAVSAPGMHDTAVLRPNMNASCGACDDFYEYANGSWLKRAMLPTGKVRWGSYDEANVATRAQLDQIVEEGVREAHAGNADSLAKIGAYYLSCMDEVAADREGAAPIQQELRRIEAIRSRDGLTAEIRHLKLSVPDLLFWADVDTDPLRPSRQILQVNQGGLSLPDQSMYVSNDADALAARAKFLSSAAAMFVAAGLPQADAQDRTRRLFAFEVQLARATTALEDTRDVLANTHVLTVAQANGLTPHWNWGAYLKSAGSDGSSRMNVRQRGFLIALDELIARRPLSDWRAYLQWQLIYAASPWLSAELRDQRQGLDASFTGAKSALPRSQRCMDALNVGLGPALGRTYAERVFSAEAKRRGEDMVANLKAAVRRRIMNSTWMSPRTRALALAKLAAVKFYLGAPAAIPNYASLTLDAPSFWGKVSQANKFATSYYSAKLSQPTDPRDWYMLPQTASGGADHSRNSFQYPAAKFQAPFFDVRFDDALNYGALGVGMAHELTHLFDDRGRLYDRNGRLHDWWTKADAAAYERRAKRLQKQFDRISIAGANVNGKLTRSENIADLGGLLIAYDALQLALRGKPRPLIEGLTPEQRFFLAWGRNFREISTPERIKRQIAGDVHAPAKARVLGPLADMVEFRRAFDCKKGDPMVDNGDLEASIW